MNFKLVLFSTGCIIALISIFMLIPALTDFSTGHIYNGWTFFQCAMGGVFFGSLLIITNRFPENTLKRREGFLLATLVWIAASIIISLPLYLVYMDTSYVDALFEAVSGVTTTGSTIYTDIDALTPGIKIWRSLSQWLGGVGVIALGIVFLPFMRVGGMQLFQMESSNTSEKALSKTQRVLGHIFGIYCALTILCFLAYVAFGMSGFDAINHALTTISTGGYSTRGASFAYFNNATLEYICVAFMILGALPFMYYIKLIYFNDKSLLRSPQIKGFLLLLACLVITFTVWMEMETEQPLSASFRLALFNIVAVITTTGYATADYPQYGGFAVIFFLLLTYLGACSGSTSGGLKVMRLQILLSQANAIMKRLIYPHGTFTPRYDGKVIEEPVLRSIIIFLSLYVTSNGILAIALSTQGLDLITSISGAATAIGNVGPGLGDIIGPTGTFEPLSDPAKLMMCAGMILGRLEIMTVFVLFHPAFWKK